MLSCTGLSPFPEGRILPAVTGNLLSLEVFPETRDRALSGYRSHDLPQVTADDQPFYGEIPAAAAQGHSYGGCIHR